MKPFLFTYNIMKYSISFSAYASLARLFRFINFRIYIIVPNCIILCCNWMTFNFSLEASLSSPCLSFLVWNLSNLSLEVSTKFSFFPFLFSTFCCFCVYSYVAVVDTGSCNKSLLFFMYSPNPCIDASAYLVYVITWCKDLCIIFYFLVFDVPFLPSLASY